MGTKSQISIMFPENESSVLDVYYETSIPQKGIDFLNAYTKQYIDYKYENKNRAATQTLDFIDEQLTSIRKYFNFQLKPKKKHLKSQNTYSEANSMTDRGLIGLIAVRKRKSCFDC